MAEKIKKHYGSWKSPITSSLLVEKAIRFGDIKIYEDRIYWTEMHPEEKGRASIMSWHDEKVHNLLPSPYNARSRVHEYGGGAFLVEKKTLFFSYFKDNQVYSLSPDGKCKNLTRKNSCYYSEPVFDVERNLIYAIEEDHTNPKQIVNRLVIIDPIGNKEVQTLYEGDDFYSSIALHPQGTHIAFLTWNHPNMPWDGTELFVANLDPNGNLFHVKHRAGGVSESVFQPLWSQDGVLHFISDRTGWWNLYADRKSGIDPCYPMEAEYGSPQWIFGMSRYGFLENGHIACIYTQEGIDTLAFIDPHKKTCTSLDLEFTEYSHLHAAKDKLVFLAASPKKLRALYTYDLKNGSVSAIRKSQELKVDPGYLSCPETLEFPTKGDTTAFGFYYPPTNKDFSPLSEEKPPLIVKSHGGPSGCTSSSLNLEVQFWTSRGFAFLDVNYGGSTGYGREYRERLKGNWGEVDVDDCMHGALYLVSRGNVDKERLAIKGGSAGGYTTLATLAFRTLFSAGVSYYGVSDLEAMARDTHKFESHYLDHLVAPYPEHQKRYRDYSPLYHTDQITCPVLLLQGSEDKVVPPDQSENMFKALKERGIPVAYILFQNEGHGFRQASTIKSAVDAELYFYSKIFHFELSDPLPSISIENLD